MSKLTTNWIRFHGNRKSLNDSINNYFRAHTPKRDINTLDVERAYRRIGTIKPFHINDVIHHYQHPEKSPGLPWRKFYKRKADIPPQKIKQIIHNFKQYNWKWTTPCLAAQKSCVAPTPKCRLIWVYPAHYTYMEQMFLMPIMNKIHRVEQYAGTLQYWRGDNRLLWGPRYIGIDFKRFDSTVPAWLIRKAFSILESCIDFDNYEHWGRPTHPDYLRSVWRRLVDYFINTPIRKPNGAVIRKRMGIPSGSAFTNVIGSICSAMVLRSLFTKGRFYTCGDDSLFEVSGRVKMTDVVKYCRRFGLIVNKEKSELGRYPTFLGYKIGPGHIRANYDKLMAQWLLPSRPDYSYREFLQRGQAIALSCLGFGCLPFTRLVYDMVNQYGGRLAHTRDKELLTKLEYLGNPPRLDLVMLLS